MLFTATKAVHDEERRGLKGGGEDLVVAFGFLLVAYNILGESVFIYSEGDSGAFRVFDHS